jgi:hypothetical protein
LEKFVSEWFVDDHLEGQIPKVSFWPLEDEINQFLVVIPRQNYNRGCLHDGKGTEEMQSKMETLEEGSKNINDRGEKKNE